MSLQFNVTASPYNGLIQRCEVNVYGHDGLGRISGNSALLGLWTTRINQASDRIISLILNSNRGEQYDDSNHTDYPEIYIDLVSGQRDYSFTTDENSNLILEIQDAYILDGSVYRKLDRVDEDMYPNFYAGQNSTGTATKFGIKATGFFLDLIPSANVTDGLKIQINREASYFTTSDTTKKPGFSGMFHHYLADYACFDYGRTNSLTNTQIDYAYIQSIEKEITDWYNRSSKNEKQGMRVANHNNR